MSRRYSRRDVLLALRAAPLLGAAPLVSLLSRCRAPGVEPLAQTRADGVESASRFLIVVGAAGGGSIIDAFLAVSASECTAAGGDAATLNTFPTAAVSTVPGTPFRAVTTSGESLGEIPRPYAADQRPFVQAHHDQMLVATTMGTSVNHAIAQHRSITGNNAWNGRTLQEAVAAAHGATLPLPNVNMAVGGFQEPGVDDSLPSYAIGATVNNPQLWHMGLSASTGLQSPLPAELIQRARDLRDRSLDPESIFVRTFKKSTRLERWFQQRSAAVALEQRELMRKLNIVDDLYPTDAFGIAASDDAALLQRTFPRHGSDPFEAQAALAFLLLKHRVSCAVSLSPSFNGLTIGSEIVNPPIAFDFSHNDHRATQAYMWSRVLTVVDKLIALLKAEPYADDGSSLWDRTLIYVATDFGRTRLRPANAGVFSTGHDLNNGVLIVSPLVKGNTVVGAVDARTTQCSGWDPLTGAAKSTTYAPNEAQLYAGLLRALSVDSAGSGLPVVTALAKS